MYKAISSLLLPTTVVIIILMYFVLWALRLSIVYAVFGLLFLLLVAVIVYKIL